MTALSVRPEPGLAQGVHALGSHYEAGDRRILRYALAVAGLLHLLAIVLPLPESPRPVSTPLTVNDPPEITDYRIPPPPVEAPAPMDPMRTDRRLFLPEPAVPFDAEPVVEPRPPLPPNLGQGAAGEFAEYDPSPPLPWIVDETRDQLVLPRPISRPEPVYPRQAIQIRLEGTVVLRAVITIDGRVASIEVLRAPVPDVGFSEAAVEAVSTWRYEPGLLHGRPVAVSMRVLVEFRLN